MSEQKEVKSYEQCHAEYAKAFVGTDFGSTDYPKLVLGGLQKVACGWANGRTMEIILLEMGLIERRRDDLVLTDAGLAEMYALNAFDQTILVAKALTTIKEQDARIAELEEELRYASTGYLSVSVILESKHLKLNHSALKIVCDDHFQRIVKSVSLVDKTPQQLPDNGQAIATQMLNNV